MGWRDWFRAPATKPVMGMPIAAASMPDPDDHLSDHRHYRRVGAPARDRREHASVVERAYEMREDNPLFTRALSLQREYIFQTPWSVEADNPRVAELLDSFWGDPVNDWPGRLPQYLDSLSLAGTLALPVRHYADGHVEVTYADPAEVSAVRMWARNCLVPAELDWCVAPPDVLVLPIVRPVAARRDARFGLLAVHAAGDEPVMPADSDLPVGCLYARLNPLPNQTHGQSDASGGVVDFLRLHEDFQRATVEKQRLINRVVADVTVNGSAAEIQALMGELSREPGYATVNVHNEAVKFQYGGHTSGAGDDASADRTIGNYATAPLGIGPHILRGDMGEGNRAIATQANDPIAIRIQFRANQLAAFCERACQFAIDSNILAGGALRSVPAEDRGFRIQRPRILKKDLAGGVAMLQQVSAALTLARSDGLVDGETGRSIFVGLVSSERGRDDITPELVAERLDAEAPLMSDLRPVEPDEPVSEAS